jgi:anti-sigma B factor antagonist
MSIEFEDLNEQIRRINLSGRLDIAGTQEISIKFTALSCSKTQHVIVDLTEVSFLSSMGIRELIGNAKALQQRGGFMVLLVEAKNSAVVKTLESTGIDDLIPLFGDVNQAIEALLAKIS